MSTRLRGTRNARGEGSVRKPNLDVGPIGQDGALEQKRQDQMLIAAAEHCNAGKVNKILSEGGCSPDGIRAALRAVRLKQRMLRDVAIEHKDHFDFEERARECNPIISSLVAAQGKLPEPKLSAADKSLVSEVLNEGRVREILAGGGCTAEGIRTALREARSHQYHMRDTAKVYKEHFELEDRARELNPIISALRTAQRKVAS